MSFMDWFSNLTGQMGTDMAIDLGTANTPVINEPSVVAIEKSTHRVLAVGHEAKNMINHTPEAFSAEHPLKDGVIADYDVTEAMLSAFINKAAVRKYPWQAKPRIVICIPCGATSVEKRAVFEAAVQAGARQAYLIEEPMAAAMGADLPVTEPTGSMVVDIGGGTTDVAVVSLGGVVISHSIRVGGVKMDEAIINYIKGMDANTFKDWIMGILENYPKQTVDVLMNFVSTHDIERAINRFGGQNCDDKSKDWMAENWLSDAEYKRGKQLLKAAMVLQFFLPGVPQVYYVGALAGKNDMELLRKTNNGRDINRHYYSTAEIDENLKRPVVKALNALAKFRNELDAFDGTFSYTTDDDTSISFTWRGETSQATLTFEPKRGLGVDNTTPVAMLEWEDSAGDHRSDDLIANPPVVA